jgi:hypothetical protein
MARRMEENNQVAIAVAPANPVSLSKKHSRPTIWVIIALTLMSMALAAARYVTFDEPLERDLTTYAVCAHEMLKGRLLYADIWDHKPPAVHITFALAEKIAGYGQQEFYLINVVAGIIALLGMYRAASIPFGPAAGLWAALFWTILSGDPGIQGNQPNTELLINCCSIWAFALLLDATKREAKLKTIVLLGMVTALSSLYKQPAICIVMAPWFASALYRLRRRISTPRRIVLEAAILPSCSVLVWAAIGLCFMALGIYKDYYDTVFTYNKDYSGDVLHNVLRPFFDCPDSLIDFVTSPAMLPLIICCAWGCLDGLIRPRRFPWFIWLFFFLGTFVAVGAPGRYWNHYHQLWLPPLCVGGAWTIANITDMVRPLVGWMKWKGYRFKIKLQLDKGKPIALRKIAPIVIGAAVCTWLLLSESSMYVIPSFGWRAQKLGGFFVPNSNFHGWTEPLQRDMISYIVGEEGWRAKVPIYSDLLDRTPPPLHLPFIVAMIASVIGIFECSALIWGRGAAIWSALVWAIVSADLTLQTPDLSPEIFTNTFNIWIFYLVIRATTSGFTLRRCILLGMLSGTASLFQQFAPLVLACLFSGSALYRLRQGDIDGKQLLRESSTLAACNLAIWAAVGAYFALFSRFNYFYSSVIGYNLSHLSSTLANLFRPLVDPACLDMFFLLPQILGLTAISCIGCLLGARREPAYPWYLLIAFALGAQLSINACGLFSLHAYQVWMPPLSMAAAWTIANCAVLLQLPEFIDSPLVALEKLLASLNAWSKLSLPWRLRPAADNIVSTKAPSATRRPAVLPSLFTGTVIAILLLLTEGPYYMMSANDWSNEKYADEFIENRKVGEEISKILLPNEQFFDFGPESELYFYSRISPAAGAILYYPLVWSPPEYHEALNKRTIEQLQKTKAELLIVREDDIKNHADTPVMAWCLKHYMPLAVESPYSWYFLARRGGELEKRIGTKPQYGPAF